MPDGGTKGGGEVNKVFGSLGGIEILERVGVSPHTPLLPMCEYVASVKCCRHVGGGRCEGGVTSQHLGEGARDRGREGGEEGRRVIKRRNKSNFHGV